MKTEVQANYMAFYGGHDASFTIYSAERDKFYVIELEKLIGVKHVNWPGNIQSTKAHNVFQGDPNCIVKLLHDYVLELGLKPEFRLVICGSYNGDITHAWKYSISPDLVLKYFHVDEFAHNKGHQEAHAWCAMMQTPVTRGLLVTCDGGGDDGYFSVWTFDRSKESMHKISITQDMRHKLGGQYEEKAQQHLDSIAMSTPIGLDLAGKVMGAAAYGTPIGPLKPKRWYDHQGGVHKKLYNEWFAAASYYGETNRFRFLNKNHMTWQEEVDTCAQIQKELEVDFDRLLNKMCTNVPELIDQHDSNFVLSGGVALNIVNNKKLEERYNCTVWVPCNPGDNGLSFGMLSKWLVQNSKLNMDTKRRYDMSFAGPSIRDLNRFEQFVDLYQTTSRRVAISDISEFLKEGEVIALMHGNSETGFRALGHRSILCDASIEGIKDKVNLTKRRELYRPFAPICRWQDAKKWFDVEGDNNYQHMNMAVKVKDGAGLSAITHADGTARLQAIDKTDKIMNELLKLHGGVLLNTSFNLSGKPITNSLFEAFHILERTPLDKLIIENEQGEFWAFTKYDDETV